MDNSKSFIPLPFFKWSTYKSESPADNTRQQEGVHIVTRWTTSSSGIAPILIKSPFPETYLQHTNCNRVSDSESNSLQFVQRHINPNLVSNLGTSHIQCQTRYRRIPVSILENTTNYILSAESPSSSSILASSSLSPTSTLSLLGVSPIRNELHLGQVNAESFPTKSIPKSEGSTDTRAYSAKEITKPKQDRLTMSQKRATPQPEPEPEQTTQEGSPPPKKRKILPHTEKESTARQTAMELSTMETPQSEQQPTFDSDSVSPTIKEPITESWIIFGSKCACITLNQSTYTCLQKRHSVINSTVPVRMVVNTNGGTLKWTLGTTSGLPGMTRKEMQKWKDIKEKLRKDIEEDDLDFIVKKKVDHDTVLEDVLKLEGSEAYPLELILNTPEHCQGGPYYDEYVYALPAIPKKYSEAKDKAAKDAENDKANDDAVKNAAVKDSNESSKENRDTKVPVSGSPFVSGIGADDSPEQA